MRITTRSALLGLAAFWAALLPLFVVWLATDRTEAPWDGSLHAGAILRLHDGLLRGNLWRVYELSRFYPPLFHVLAVPASFFSTHPDAYSFGNWVALLAVLWGTFLVGRALVGVPGALAAAVLVPAYGWVTWMGRMVMTDLTLTATVVWTLVLLSRPLDLSDRRQAHRLGIAVALGFLAKWPYAFYTFPPLAWLLWRHWLDTGREPRARAFWRPLVPVLAWPLALAGPWYVRSVPSLLHQASWHLGSGVVADEGDPAALSFAAFAYYARKLWLEYMSLPLLILLAAGFVVLLRAWRHGDRREIAPPRRWLPLALSVAGALVCLELITNKDGRYLMPIIPALAVVSGASVAVLPSRARGGAVVLLALLSWGLAYRTLFVVSPPDPRDWKIADTAELLAPRLDRAGTTRVLVVPNDLQLNSNALAYALQRVSPAKADVHRVEHVLDAPTLDGFRFAVVVVPPPPEAAVSRGTVAAAELVLSRGDWSEVSRFARGDGREIVVLEKRAPGA